MNGNEQGLQCRESGEPGWNWTGELEIVEGPASVRGIRTPTVQSAYKTTKLVRELRAVGDVPPSWFRWNVLQRSNSRTGLIRTRERTIDGAS